MQLHYTAIALQSINFTKYYIIRGNIHMLFYTPTNDKEDHCTSQNLIWKQKVTVGNLYELRVKL